MYWNVLKFVIQNILVNTDNSRCKCPLKWRSWLACLRFQIRHLSKRLFETVPINIKCTSVKSLPKRVHLRDIYCYIHVSPISADQIYTTPMNIYNDFSYVHICVCTKPISWCWSDGTHTSPFIHKGICFRQNHILTLSTMWLSWP